jgi:predicted Zn-dependent protease
MFRCAALFALASVAVFGQANNSANFYSLAKERSLGAMQAEQMREKTTPIDNPAVTGYLQRMSDQLAATMPHSEFPFTLAIVKNDIGGPLHEPVALEGGYIFVPAALFLTAQNDAEIAGMLGHAMQHVITRDATRGATRHELAQLVTIPVVLQGGVSPQQMADVSLGRSFESSADLAVVRSMAAAGIDPQGLLNYISRVQPAFNAELSDLPSREARISAIRSEIAKLPARNYGGAFEAVQNQVRQSLQ